MSLERERGGEREREGERERGREIGEERERGRERERERGGGGGGGERRGECQLTYSDCNCMLYPSGHSPVHSGRVPCLRLCHSPGQCLLVGGVSHTHHPGKREGGKEGEREVSTQLVGGGGGGKSGGGGGAESTCPPPCPLAVELQLGVGISQLAGRGQATARMDREVSCQVGHVARETRGGELAGEELVQVPEEGKGEESEGGKGRRRRRRRREGGRRVREGGRMGKRGREYVVCVCVCVCVCLCGMECGPGSLEEHDCVLSLVSVGCHMVNVEMREATGQRVSMTTTRHATGL